MHTPTRPVATAYPWAACPAPCSWRTRMCRIEESRSGSYAGRIAPPGMPKMCSVPAASRDLIKLCAPLIVAPACWLITVSCLVLVPELVWCRETKNPSAEAARGDARIELGSTRASGAYKKLGLGAHGATVPVPVLRRQASVPPVPDTGTAVPPCGTPRAAVLVASPTGGQAGLVALGVGEHPEAWGVLGGDQGAAGLERRGQPRLHHVGRHPHVEVEALPRLLVLLGLLEPQRRQRAGEVAQLAVVRRVVRHREHSSPERLDLVAVPGVETDLDHGGDRRVGGDAEVGRGLADPTRQVEVTRGHPEDVVAEDGHVDVGVAQVDVGMMVGGLGQLADARGERQAGGEVAGQEPRAQGLEQLPPVRESRSLDLVEGQPLGVVHGPTLHPNGWNLHPIGAGA